MEQYVKREVEPLSMPYIDGTVIFDGKSRIRFGNGNYIDFQRQKKVNDCGQTCLKMLLKNELPEDLKQAEIWNYQLFDFGGELVKERVREVPHMVHIETKQNSFHWVIALGGLVIDPNRGIFKADEYERENIADVLGFYKVPFKGQSLRKVA